MTTSDTIEPYVAPGTKRHTRTTRHWICRIFGHKWVWVFRDERTLLGTLLGHPIYLDVPRCQDVYCARGCPKVVDGAKPAEPAKEGATP